MLGPTQPHAPTSEHSTSDHAQGWQLSTCNHAPQVEGFSDSHQVESSGPRPRTRVRNVRKTSRRVATLHQLSFLEPAFERSQSLTSFRQIEKDKLRRQVDMSPRQLGHWFQNRYGISSSWVAVRRQHLPYLWNITRRSLVKSCNKDPSPGSGHTARQSSISSSSVLGSHPPSAAIPRADLGLGPSYKPVLPQPAGANGETNVSLACSSGRPDCRTLSALGIHGLASDNDLPPSHHSFPKFRFWSSTVATRSLLFLKSTPTMHCWKSKEQHSASWNRILCGLMLSRKAGYLPTYTSWG